MLPLHNTNAVDAHYAVDNMWTVCLYCGAEGVLWLVSGVDLSCKPSANFGASPRVEWKFDDLKGTQTYVIFDGKPTGKWLLSD